MYHGFESGLAVLNTSWEKEKIVKSTNKEGMIYILHLILQCPKLNSANTECFWILLFSTEVFNTDGVWQADTHLRIIYGRLLISAAILEVMNMNVFCVVTLLAKEMWFNFYFLQKISEFISVAIKSNTIENVICLISEVWTAGLK